MSIGGSGDVQRPAAGEHHNQNHKLFTRRRRLLQRMAAIREKTEADPEDADAEAELRRLRRELEELTHEIMEANYGLVRRYVAMFTSRSSMNIEDFESAGRVGLLRAICSYDPSRGSFGSWAFKPIQREVLRAVRDADHPNLNPGDFERRPHILAAERALADEADPGAAPDFAAIAQRAGVSEAQVRRVLAPPRLDSLQLLQAIGTEEAMWRDRLADPSLSIEDEVVMRQQLRMIKRGLPTLDGRERYVLARRFGLDGKPEQSLRIIGQQLGLSGEGVRLIQQKALTKLGQPLEDADAD